MRYGWIWLSLVACSPEAPVGEAVPLYWDTPLTSELLGVEVSEQVDGASLQEVVSGQVEARGDRRTCTACHFNDTITNYRPEVEQYSTETMGAYSMVHGRTWAGNNGWAAVFISLGPGAFVEKPEELREAMALWLDAESDRVDPLRWNDVIVASMLGVEPEPYIAGDTLREIVNSVVPARPDDLSCSSCHYEDGPYPYQPEISKNQITDFGPDEVLDGRSWAGPGGWASVFSELGPNATVHKPDYLRQLFFKWQDDGAY